MNTSIQVSNPSYISRYNFQVESDPILTVTRAINASLRYMRNNEYMQIQSKKHCYKTIISLNQDSDCNEIKIEDNGIGIENPHFLWESIKKGLQNNSLFGDQLSCFSKICDKITIISKIDIADEFFKLDIHLNTLREDPDNSYNLSWIRTLYDSQRADFLMLSYTKIILTDLHPEFQFTDIEYIKPYILDTNQYLRIIGRDEELKFSNVKTCPIKFIKDLNGDVFEVKPDTGIYEESEIVNPAFQKYWDGIGKLILCNNS